MTDPAPDRGGHTEVAFQAWVPPAQIAVLAGLLEGYEGVAVFRTNDRVLGWIEFWVPRNNLLEFETMVADVQSEMPLRVDSDHPAPIHVH